MNYLLKCTIQHILSNIPKGEIANRWLQIHGTKNLPVNEELLLNKISLGKLHLDYYLKYNTDSKTSFEDIISFEFGAGYDLIIPIIFSYAGIKSITCVDIKDKVSAYLISNIVDRLKSHKDLKELTDINNHSYDTITKSNVKEILKNNFRINYIAPMDASKTNFPDEHLDLIVTNATFEHIPLNSIKDILKESYRILKPGGVFSNIIDYKDHWAYTDSRLSYYNYLKYSPKKWKFLNPSLNYQNRLRHKDYIELFESAGFKLKYILPRYPTEEEKNALSNLKIDDYFKSKYTIEELEILSGIFVATKS